MGNRSSSSSSTEGSCGSCGADHKSWINTSNNEHTTCSRCGTIVQERPTNANTKNVKKKNNSGAYAGIDTDEKQREPTQPIIRLHLCPFIETLPDDHQHFTEEQLLDAYIRPYFSNLPNQQLPAINPFTRFQIKEVDFRVIGSFPPVGICTRHTIIRCMSKPMHALNHVNRLHVLPTKASLRDRHLDSRTLFNDCVKPYFAGEGRHVYVGETFMSNGVQFKVINCEPSDGVVDRNSIIFTDGDPLVDLNRVHLLPIYESLPNNEKKISSEQTIEKYLKPYFLGRDRVVTRNDRIDIDGVEFKVMSIDPDIPGVVTLNTRLHAEGEPLRADELKRQQEEEDEAMARRMQQQESGVHGRMLEQHEQLRMRLAEVLRLMPENDPHRPFVQRLLQLGSLPGANGGGRLDQNAMFSLFLRSVAQGGAPPPQGAPQTAIDSLPTRHFTPLITKKPTTTSTSTSTSEPETKEEKEAAEAAKAAVTCMVCLSEYEQGEELRTLPCFHSYHRECIDTWLERSKACPICKNPIC